MELNSEIYSKMIAIDWFRHSGSELPSDFPFPVQRISTLSDAVNSALGHMWQDVRTEAQGDMTGHLARRHADAYASWNSLARESRQRMQKDVMPRVNDRLTQICANALSETVLLDLNRIAIYTAYANKFRGIPDFFRKLLAVYEWGYLPCGWNGCITFWPEGQLIVY
ncbi:MAG: hypothetical protein ACK6D3_02195 [Planctomycetaceae bacterium]|jgi:hypothetical protein